MEEEETDVNSEINDEDDDSGFMSLVNKYWKKINLCSTEN